MWLAEAIEAVVNLCRDSVNVKHRIYVEDFPRFESTIVVDADGNHEWADWPRYHKRQLIGLGALGGFIARYKSVVSETVVYVDGNTITIDVVEPETDMPNREPITVCQLIQSELGNELATLHENGRSVDLGELCDLVRNFQRWIVDGSELLAILEVMTFNTNDQRAESESASKSSYGRTVQHEVQSAVTKDFPESITFRGPLFDDLQLGKTFTVSCAMKARPQRDQFDLTIHSPDWLELQHNKREYLQCSIEAIVSDGVAVLMGRVDIVPARM